MQINTAIYGAPETWYTPAGDYGTKPAIKLPTWGSGYYNHYYFGAFQENIIQYNGAPVDVSLAFWGIGSDAPYCKPFFFFPTLAVDGSYVYTTHADTHKYNVLSGEGSIPLTAAVYGTNYSITANSTPEHQYTPNGVTPATSIQGACQPVLDFKYNNIVLCPVIIAARDTTGSDDSGLDFTSYSITDYFDNGGQVAYPYIVGVTADIYIAINSSVSRTKDNDALKLWYPVRYAAHMSSWEGEFTKYTTAFYSVQAFDRIRISGGYTTSIDSSYNFNFGANQSFTTENEAFARFTRENYSDNIGILLDNGKYDFKVVENTGYCTITPIWENATKDEVLSEVAYLGYWFCDDTTTAVNAWNGQNCIDTKMHIPVWDDNGITTGEWLSGAAAAAVAPADDDTARDIAPDYDPDKAPENIDVDYGDITNLGGKRRYTIPGYNIYLLDSSTYQQVLNDLNTYYSDKTPDDWTIDFQGVNPSDYILALYDTQIALPKTSSGVPVKIGPITLNHSAYKLDFVYDYWYTFSYGTRTVTPLYYDFRDYSPYTEVELYLPLAGTLKLETAYVMNHDITVTYYYDVIAASGTVAVYRDQMLYRTIDFAMGAQQPLLSSNMGSYQNQIAQLEMARKQNNMRLAGSTLALAGGIAATIASGGTAVVPELLTLGTGVKGVVQGMQTAEELDYKMSHTAPSVSTTGAADAMNALCVGQLMPKLIIKRPVMSQYLNNEIYAHTVGNACCKNNKVGSNTGLTVCSNIDTTGIPATADEINAIKQAFANGVIL